MPVSVDPALRGYIERHSDSCEVTAEGGPAGGAALAGLRTAAARIAAIAHPDEPSEGLPNFVEVQDQPDGPVLTFDIKDWGPEFAEVITRIIVESLEGAGFSGSVKPAGALMASDDAGGVPDWVTDRFDGMRPHGFPTSFPEPTGARPISGGSTYTHVSMSWVTPSDGPAVMAEFERTLPNAGYRVVLSADILGGFAYVGAIAFSGRAAGEVSVRVIPDSGTSVEGTVYLEPPSEFPLVEFAKNPEHRAHLRVRIGSL